MERGQRRAFEAERSALNGWQGELLRRVGEAVRGEPLWGEGWRGVHLVVMAEPYLSLLMEGKKSVEARFSKSRRAPWGCVRRGDLLLLKKTSGPVVGMGVVGEVWSFEIEGVSGVEAIRREFGGRVCGGVAFWGASAGARYGTLLEVEGVRPVKPVKCHKRDQRGWVVLREGVHRQ